MRKLNLMLPILFLMMGCNTVPKSYTLVQGEFITNSENSDCSKTISYVKKKWAIHNNFHCFYYSKSAMDKIVKNENCFIGVTRDELIVLFGDPNTNSKNVVVYNLAKDCEYGSSIVAEYALQFYIDLDKDIVTYLKFTKVQMLD